MPSKSFLFTSKTQWAWLPEDNSWQLRNALEARIGGFHLVIGEVKTGNWGGFLMIEGAKEYNMSFLGLYTMYEAEQRVISEMAKLMAKVIHDAAFQLLSGETAKASSSINGHEILNDAFTVVKSRVKSMSSTEKPVSMPEAVVHGRAFEKCTYCEMFFKDHPEVSPGMVAVCNKGHVKL
jgi:hypothetical protein